MKNLFRQLAGAPDTRTCCAQPIEIGVFLYRTALNLLEWAPARSSAPAQANEHQRVALILNLARAGLARPRGRARSSESENKLAAPKSDEHTRGPRARDFPLGRFVVHKCCLDFAAFARAASAQQVEAIRAAPRRDHGRWLARGHGPENSGD